MRFQRIHEAVHYRPWFISASGYASVRMLLDKAMARGFSASIADDIAEDIGDFVRQRPSMIFDEVTGIARIHIFGVLGQHLSKIEKTCGNTDYADVMSEIDLAKGSGARAILFIFDSPGGMVTGCDECAQAIANCGIDTVAWSDSLACSAAYYLAAGCKRIVATRTAIVGNIGVICPWVDESKLWEIEGIDFQPITSEGADLKSTFHGPSITEEQRAFVQEDINQAGALFRMHVGFHRVQVDDEVWRAGWYSGDRAKSLGLIDEVGSLNMAVEGSMLADRIRVG